jgi:hypothetical protein
VGGAAWKRGSGLEGPIGRIGPTGRGEGGPVATGSRCRREKGEGVFYLDTTVIKRKKVKEFRGKTSNSKHQTSENPSSL